MEVAFTSSAAGPVSVTVWDLKTGASIASYSGDIVQPKTLSFVKKDYLLTASRKSRMFCVWMLLNHRRIHKRLDAPGVVNAMVIDNRGEMCMAGINNDLFLWQLPSGILEAVIPFHYEPVTVVRSLHGGDDLFVSASMDSTIAVWRVSDITSGSSEPVKPMMVFNSHSTAVTDVAVSGALVASVSVSGLLAVHCTRSGTVVMERNLGKPLGSVEIAMGGGSCNAVFVGCRDGTIVRVSLLGGDNDTFEWSGHTGPVTCLSLSIAQPLLLSGSDDCTARLWHTDTGVSLHVMRHKNIVTDVCIARFPSSTFMETISPTIPYQLSNFQKVVSNAIEMRPVNNMWLGEIQRPNFYHEQQIVPVAPPNSRDTPEERRTLLELAIANRNLFEHVLVSL